MNRDSLMERRKWFRVFPEGTLEFNIITRVLALMMLMALAIVGGTQRPVVLVGLFGILWLDYVLLLWWVVQVATDLRAVSDPIEAGQSSSRRAWVAVQAALPSIAAVAALLPWPSLLAMLTGSGSHATMARSFQAISGLVFIVTLVPAYRALQSIRLSSPVWTILLLVPLLHFFALHRIASGLDARLAEQLQNRGDRPGALGSASGAMLAADLTYVLSILPWALVIAIVLVRGWPTSGAFKAGPVCGTMIAALFAIANLAAMEAVQRKVVALIRRA